MREFLEMSEPKDNISEALIRIILSSHTHQS